ncbi:MAG: DUF1592 domain-containing protein [Candidatus Solibacter sp.]
MRPFLTRYCIGCHGGASPAAQFDLRAYSSLTSVVKDFPHWSLISDRLSAQEMPPAPLPQPPDAVRRQVIEWIQAVRSNEARKNDGDPGPVLMRRLSNAEYNNSIRDLTGINMRPTREFPVDPANTAGFDNTGESLTMSPALLNKYLQAAREVGDHMVLTPDGFDFSPHPMLVETDREKYAIQRIVNFYLSQPTRYVEYFEAAWRYKHRAVLGTPNATLESVARESKVSTRYLHLIWDLLAEPPEKARKEVGPIAKLQEMWRALPEPGGDPLDLRDQCEGMRDFIMKLRAHTALEFTAPVVRGLVPTSQPLLNYKYRQFNTHRRDFDRTALRAASDPVPEVPRIPRRIDLAGEAAKRNAALMLKARDGDMNLVYPDGQREAYEASFARFASVFPTAFYIKERGRFFPDDSDDKGRLLSAGYHNVMGYWRDDNPLQELILEEADKRRLDRLWDEFDFIADHTARTWTQYFFNQSGEILGTGNESGNARPEDKAVTDSDVIFGLRDLYLKKAEAANNPVAIEAIKQHFQWENDTLRYVEKMRQESEPKHLDALVRFAARAFRRPLTKVERDDILGYYRTLRDKSGLSHEEAIRDSIVGILMSPKFCYRADLFDTAAAAPASGAANQFAGKPARPAASSASNAAMKPLSGYAVASRLSFFLWSSMPDDELLARAAAGDLERPEVLTAQAHRMLKDDRSRALATEFAGSLFDFRRFEEHNAVDRDRFPSFTNELREAMYQEPVRFIDNLIRNNGSLLDMLYGKYTFVNAVLAKHYGMPDVKGDADTWVRVDNADEFGRGSLLPMSVFLTQNAPGLRTSPVKRGYWVARRVLGEVIPPPPPNVPELPQDEAKLDLPLREMLAKHRENRACASCHARFDSFGLAFEGYGPIGERRKKDLAGRPIEDSAVFPGGAQGAGLDGVRGYIREHRQQDFVDNFSRKLLAFGLGRSLQLSDEPLLARMQAKLTAGGNRFIPLVDAIVTSPQFLNRRRPEASSER